jgi:hypothetical protein
VVLASRLREPNSLRYLSLDRRIGRDSF